MKTFLDFNILPQPDDSSCGPTCLHALYRYYGDPVSIEQVIREVSKLDNGGTFAVLLACHALKRGYRARIYTYNLQVFDPTWFGGKAVIQQKLRQQMKHKKSRRMRIVTRGYLDFFDLGGELYFEDLTTSLIRKHLNNGIPILTGLSATYLYQNSREAGCSGKEDDVRGEPQGHFVILCGYDREEKEVVVADPLESNPISRNRLYRLNIGRVINSILLGTITYDANLLIIEPPEERK